MKTFNLAVIAGDGIGPEVVAQGIKVLDVVASKYQVKFDKKEYELGAKYWHKTKEADRKSTRLNSSHVSESRMPSSA